ncbi:MAG: hypothetical protein U0R80_16640 [Nocardioidaceae bacterium]
MTRSSSRKTVLTVAGCALALAAVGGTSYAAGQITGGDIKDKTLGPNDLLVRVASAQVDDDAVSGVTGQTVALKVKIVAPTKGYLVTVASSDVFDSSSATFANCSINLGPAYVFGTERSIELDPGTNQEENCDTNVSIPVKAGPHVVKFMADPGETTTIFDETTLQVEFVPFNGVGKPPTNAEINGAIQPVVKASRPGNR